MLERIKKIPAKVRSGFKSADPDDARSSLARLERSLAAEWREDLTLVAGAPKLDLEETEDLQASIENLTDCYTAIRRLQKSDGPVSAEKAAGVIVAQIATTKQLIADRGLTGDKAMNVAFKTLNLLFAGEQDLKQRFSLNGNVHGNANGRRPQSPVREAAATVIEPKTPTMVLPSAMMFQLRQDLFPAERMIVGAGRRTGKSISIEALFDVTGQASAAGVRAHPDRLAQALIAMSQTGTYFALWIHSHPGLGPDATRPSSIDLRQHADWLKNFSPNLVSAIMVADRFVRFWGTAFEAGDVAVAMAGDGVTCVSTGIYKLEV